MIDKVVQPWMSYLCAAVMTDHDESYGAVKVWTDGAYSLVCADRFTDAEALVVCRNMGYTYGKSLCCDAFGKQVMSLQIYFQ